MKRYNRIILCAWCIGAAVIITGCDNRQDTSRSTPNTNVGTTIDDSIITTMIKSGLLADSGINSADIVVETNKGVVRLSGVVENKMQMERAVDIARTVEGVKDIENRMTVKP
jgi:hyperosmotically inducible periplasmic protein